MNGHIIYSAGHTDALKYTQERMQQHGYGFVSRPDPSVTHLLLDVPSFAPDGTLRSGGVLEDILNILNKEITVIGGNLSHPALCKYKTVDLLQDPVYLAANADITAHCAIKLATNNLPITLNGCPVLILGWGRIGKCLARLLRNLGAKVTVAARKETDRAILLALGYDTAAPAALDRELSKYRIIFNTAPTMLLPKEAVSYCNANCLKIDLASTRGIAGDDVLWARGLPGKDAPESSGALIAQTILRLDVAT